MSDFLDAYMAELEIVDRAKEPTLSSLRYTAPELIRGRAGDVRPCCARIRTVDRHYGFCQLPTGHVGEHHGVVSAEIGGMDFGPKRAQSGCKK